jgi:hypothetical protein
MAGPPPPVSFDTRVACKVCGKPLTPEEIVKYGDYCAAHAPPPPPEEDDDESGSSGWLGGLDASQDPG